MPIITTQRRMAEQGRIRLGQKNPERGFPMKLSAFRFTSPSQRLIEEIAATYGGKARPWDNAGKAEWEVLSDATSIPVIVVKGGFSQWHEAWTKAGCQHRCDGEKDVAGNYCDPQDPLHLEAIEKPTTRLSVMLSEIETLGVWRMESKGWNAAAELPSMAELAMHVGDLVPATLSLAERSSIIQTPRGPQTSRFVVPVLDLHVTKARLVQIVGGPGGAPALGTGEAAADSAGAAPALEAPRPDYAAIADTILDLDSLRDLWQQAAQAGHLDDGLKQQLTARVEKIKAAAAEEPAEPVANEDGTYDAVVVDDADPGGGDADTVWQEILRAGGEQGMTLADVEDDFARKMGGLTSDSASASELRHYLEQLTGAGAAA